MKKNRPTTRMYSLEPVSDSDESLSPHKRPELWQKHKWARGIKVLLVFLAAVGFGIGLAFLTLNLRH